MSYRFNEFSPQTIDFTDPQVVAEYNRKQGTDIERERRLVAELLLRPEHSVIEFGPGTGALSIAMAEICEHVYAVDTSQAMLSYIESSSKLRGIHNISTHHAGFLSYQHEGPPVDLVVTKFALHHLPDFWKGVAFARINEMLRSGGHFYIQDVIFSFRPERYQQSIDRWITELTATGGWSRDEFEVHVNEEFSTFSWILEGLLQVSGFTVRRARYWTDTYGEILSEKLHNRRDERSLIDGARR